MKEVVLFLNELSANNNKVWFDAHRDVYKSVNERFNSFAEQLIRGVEAFDDSVKGLQVKDCTYRIYKDVRFSKDKTPYKTHMGVYIAQGGKKSGYAGYYFHVEANGADFLGNHLLACGLHCADNKVLSSVRTEIVDNFKGFTGAVKGAKGYSLNMSTQMSRVPKGFDKEFEGADFLKLKDYLLDQILSEKVVLSDDLLPFVLGEFKKCKPFVDLLNKATQFAFEEM